MAIVGMKIKHFCRDCGASRVISKIQMAQRNGTRCRQCGGPMEPSAEGWAKLAEANSAKRGYKAPLEVVNPYWEG